jgi:hypothetical protein
MTNPVTRGATAPSLLPTITAWTATALLSLILLLAPQVGHAAAAAKEPDIVGKWMVDRNLRDLDYTVVAGATPGTYTLTIPGKAVGHGKGQTVSLQRVGPGKFETVKGSELHGSFIVSDPRHAEFKGMQNTKQSFGIVDQLLERP